MSFSLGNYLSFPSTPSTGSLTPSAVAPSTSVSVNAAAPEVSSPSVGARVVGAGGGKTITLVGGVALLLNNVTGSGMVLFPQLYQESGWLAATIALFFLAAVTLICAVMLIEAIALIPANGNFTRRVEYSTLCRHYMPKWAFWILLAVYQLSLLGTNIAMIVQSMQVMDFTIAQITGMTCAAPQFSPSFEFGCSAYNESLAGVTAFECDAWLIPLGFYITAVIVIPLALINLDDNQYVQVGAFYAVCIIVVLWLALFGSKGLTADNVPIVHDKYASVVGICLFNFAFITSIPSWINEKQEKVSVNWTLGTAVPLATMMFVLIGWFGGMAFDTWTNDDTLLNQLYYLGDGTSIGHLARATYYTFPAVVNLTSIPVFSIFMRYNLLEQKICSRLIANIWAVALPWLIAIPLYNGSGYNQLATWSGLLASSVVNFIIPPIIYIIAIKQHIKLLNHIPNLSSSSPIGSIIIPALLPQSPTDSPRLPSLVSPGRATSMLLTKDAATSSVSSMSIASTDQDDSPSTPDNDRGLLGQRALNWALAQDKSRAARKATPDDTQPQRGSLRALPSQRSHRYNDAADISPLPRSAKIGSARIPDEQASEMVPVSSFTEKSLEIHNEIDNKSPNNVDVDARPLDAADILFEVDEKSQSRKDNDTADISTTTDAVRTNNTRDALDDLADVHSVATDDSVDSDEEREHERKDESESKSATSNLQLARIEETVAEPIERWSVVPTDYAHYRIPVAYVVCVVMSILVVFSIVMQIRSTPNDTSCPSS